MFVFNWNLKERIKYNPFKIKDLPIIVKPEAIYGLFKT